MKSFFLKFTLFLLALSLTECKQNDSNSVAAKKTNSENQIHYAKGFSIYKYKGFSVVNVSNPWPKANQNFTYILKEKNGIVPDSLKQYTTIAVPIQTIVVTSTTHIPSLEMLGVENSLIGFPHLEYISSEKVRTRIEQGKIRELGNNQDLNTEVLLDSAPDLIIGYGIDNNNPALDNLQKSGLKVMLNGDWNEETPLGKAEWIKFFGAIYGLDKKANSIFTTIENEYKKTMELALKAKTKPTVFAGAIYENQWFMPQGNSWGSYFIKDAFADYLWKETNGTGSLALSFETVLEKAKDADFWIGPGQFTSFKEMADANAHYMQFSAFKNKKVYSFSSKKGKTGGVIYYELAPNRPDLVLKDILKIVHPELLPDYKLFFFEPLK
ncbi:ABC transporter substrate-binding protein [Flavobacterium psychrotolerans]|uniref:ABC transporter substrate-binding protein n=1 Tax=Flavobacterium psychrotolerans TaxID=2169410 RepID=A0A2U1JK44_9FLAO|nr:ABC transporter substrate-binding protein [Flavobacterium psychrotolerans]PWA05359.1 ABC transporter substrate-binding protein [Flavobacterium psychrotolerans]